jgi:hypothetical protein
MARKIKHRKNNSEICCYDTSANAFKSVAAYKLLLKIWLKPAASISALAQTAITCYGLLHTSASRDSEKDHAALAVLHAQS